MAFCTECGSQTSDSAKFCAKCGHALAGGAPKKSFNIELPKIDLPKVPVESVKKAQNAVGSALGKAFDNSILFVKRFLKWIISAVILAVAAAVAFAIFVKPPLDPKHLPKLAEEYSSTTLHNAAATTCGDLSTVLVGSKSLDFETLKAHSARVSSTYDARQALKVSNAGWYTSDGIVLSAFDLAVTDAVKPALSKILDSDYRVTSTTRASILDAWMPDWIYFAAQTCGYASNYQDAIELVGGYTAARDSLDSLALTAPWYPVGYNSWSEDENLAWKWNNSASCSTYSFGCWHIDVITNEECTGGIYAEINVTSNGSVVGYANDSLPYLGYGAKARLELTNTTDGHQGTLETLTCHTY